MLSWKNQWKGIHIVEGIFPFQKQGGKKKIKLKGLGLCAPTGFTQSESHTCSEPCCTGRQPPQMLWLERWVVNELIFEGNKYNARVLSWWWSFQGYSLVPDTQPSWYYLPNFCLLLIINKSVNQKVRNPFWWASGRTLGWEPIITLSSVNTVLQAGFCSPSFVRQPSCP